MLNDERYDFLQETDLKERLWEMMQQKMKEAAPARKEVSFHSLGGGANRKQHPAGHGHTQPAAAPKGHDKSK